MNWPAVLLIVATCSTVGAGQQTPQCKSSTDVRISKDDPTVFISFERFGKALDLSQQRMVQREDSGASKEKGDDVWLRVHNNTCWPVIFLQFGLYATKKREGETAADWGNRLKRMGFGTLDDGVETGLYYWVNKADGKRVFMGSDVSADVSLLPGNSVLFSVLKSDLSKDQSIEVYFNYEWEFWHADEKKSWLVDEPSHRLSLRNYEFEEMVKARKKK